MDVPNYVPYLFTCIPHPTDFAVGEDKAPKRSYNPPPEPLHVPPQDMHDPYRIGAMITLAITVTAWAIFMVVGFALDLKQMKEKVAYRRHLFIHNGGVDVIKEGNLPPLARFKKGLRELNLMQGREEGPSLNSAVIHTFVLKIHYL